MNKVINIDIEPSILSANMLNLEEDLKKITLCGIHTIHVDIMDGDFAPNLTFGPDIVKFIKKSFPQLKQDCHLMVKDPLLWIKKFAESGADSITFHIEATKDELECINIINEIKKYNIKVGIAVNPSTDISSIYNHIESNDVDFVLIMTVNPGFSGQKFIEECADKIKTLHKKYTIPIQVDGGINENTIVKCYNAGARIFVSGSTLFKNPNMSECVEKLTKNLA